MNGSKRPCVILVADGTMGAIFEGFFSRDQWHKSLRCAPFEFDCAFGGDLVVATGKNDSGTYTSGHELLQPYLSSHERALVVLDCEWDGSPGKDVIIQHITDNLLSSGWDANSIRVIVIEPELENWVWQDHPLVSEALRYREEIPLRELLATEGFWPEGQTKPTRPKETAIWVARRTRLPYSSAIHKQLSKRISVRGCTDAAFMELHTTLQTWFPAEEWT